MIVIGVFSCTQEVINQDPRGLLFSSRPAIHVYLEFTDYFESRRRHHGVDPSHVQEALVNEVYRVRQPDGRLRVWGYVAHFNRYVRVVLLEDGFTVLNAFPDRSFKRPAES